MKNNVLRASVLAAGLCLMSAPLVAHHGDAGRYDESAFVITGTIVEIRLTNPHSIMVFDVTDADGKVVRWQAEMSGGQAVGQAVRLDQGQPENRRQDHAHRPAG